MFCFYIPPQTTVLYMCIHFFVSAECYLYLCGEYDNMKNSRNVQYNLKVIRNSYYSNIYALLFFRLYQGSPEKRNHKDPPSLPLSHFSLSLSPSFMRFLIRNWFMRLWRLRSPTICNL